MRLRLSVEGGAAQPPGRAEHVFDQRGGVIGRGNDCDWVLECPDKLLSRRHAVVAFEDGRFYLYDASANGVFHNEAATPIGPGGRVELADGDSLRMGNLLIRARLLAEAAAEPASAAAEPGPLAEVQAGADAVRVTRAVLSAAFSDAFHPPRVTIPADVDLSPRLTPEAAPASAINRQFDALEPAASRALRQELLSDADPSDDFELTPEAARALARSLRLCLEGIFALSGEFDAVERRLANRKAADGGSLPAADVERFCRALLGEQDDDERNRQVAALGATVARLRGRHALIAGCFEQSVNTILEQFAPDKFEKRLQRQLSGRGKGERLRRLKYRVSKDAVHWQFYKNWYETQRKSVFSAVHQLFEKRMSALYAERLRDLADRPLRESMETER